MLVDWPPHFQQLPKSSRWESYAEQRHDIALAWTEIAELRERAGDPEGAARARYSAELYAEMSVANRRLQV